MMNKPKTIIAKIKSYGSENKVGSKKNQSTITVEILGEEVRLPVNKDFDYGADKIRLIIEEIITYE